ncbi:MAG: DNA-3-methyladenine glycosylase I [Sinobacteraceae bacterium]|nr:DNA-3-methyladenine glycosylase I [Nevskiaceae bacterium]
MLEPRRCTWAGDDSLMQAYHDREWGRPQHDERALFEFLILEGAQAGLSWRTILGKREHYRRAFHGFDAEAIARYGAKDRARLLADPGIVRNRLKIDAAIGNARAYLKLREAQGSLDRWLWDWVDGESLVNRWRTAAQVPARTPLSDRISQELRRRGFQFVGSTIVYAYLQAVGVVNDHLLSCFCHPQAAPSAGGRRGSPPVAPARKREPCP